MLTPRQCVSSFDQVVTQWMSTVISVCGSLPNSSQLHLPSSEPSSCSAKLQLASFGCWRRPGRQHGEVVRQMLAGRHAVRLGALALAAAKAA